MSGKNVVGYFIVGKHARILPPHVLFAAGALIGFNNNTVRLNHNAQFINNHTGSAYEQRVFTGSHRRPAVGYFRCHRAIPFQQGHSPV